MWKNVRTAPLGTAAIAVWFAVVTLGLALTIGNASSLLFGVCRFGTDCVAVLWECNAGSPASDGCDTGAAFGCILVLLPLAVLFVTGVLVPGLMRLIPREGAIIFGDLIGKLDVLYIHCPKCSRAGRYRYRFD